jgi:hypothetical protein
MTSGPSLLAITLVCVPFVGCGGGGKSDQSAGGAGGFDGTAAGGSAGRGVTIGSSGRGGSTSSVGNAGGGSSDKCAELAACCPTVSNANLKAAACGSAASFDCSLAFATLLGNGECREDPGSKLPEVTLDGKWSATKELATLVWDGTDMSLSTPQIVPCGEGDAVAAWYKKSGAIGEVQAARYSAAAGSWQIFSRIDKNSGLQPDVPSLAVNDSCQALVTWTERLPVLGSGGQNEYTLVGATYGADGTFSAPFTVQALSTAEPRSVSIGLTPDGLGLLSYSSGSSMVRREYQAGSGLTAATPLSAKQVNNARFSMLENGTALQVYSEYDADTSATSLRFELHTSGWSAAAPLLPSGASDYNLRVVAAGDRFYVQYGSSEMPALVSVMADGTVGEPQEVPAAGSGARLAAHGEHQLLVWATSDNQLMSMQRSNSDAWSDPEPIQAAIHKAFEYALAVDSAGRAIVVYGDSDYAVFANRRTADGKWLGVHALNADGREPTLAVNARGTFFAAYQGTHGGLANLRTSSWAQLFTPTP